MSAQQTALAEPILVAQGISKRFGGLVAVDGVDLSIARGSITSVIGPNGAGKTTFFNIVAGIYKPTTGSIVFEGTSLANTRGRFGSSATRPDQVTSLGIARTFQNIRLFANMSALDNVLIGMHTRMKSSAFGAMLRTKSVMAEERAARETAYSLLDFVSLPNRADTLAKNLSYGEQRRLEIARALGSQPRLLLLDEPTAGMNPQETADLTGFIDRIRQQLNLTILLIEHDMKVVMGISDHVAVLDHGSKIAEGAPADVRSNPLVIEAYLGKGAAEEQRVAPAGDAFAADIPVASEGGTQ